MSSQISLAAEWQITPSVEISEVYNDNINLAPNGSKVGDFISTVSPGVHVTGTGRRLQLDLDYDPQLLVYARGNGSNRVQQRLLGDGRVEAIEDEVFFDTRASVEQQFINAAGPVSATTLTNSGNLQTVATYQLGPEFRHHFGPYANAESSVKYSAVRSGGAGFADSDAVDSKAQLSGGEYFGRLGWAVTGEDQRTNFSSVTAIPALSPTTPPLGAGRTSRDQSIRSDFQYALTNWVSALAGAGYEKIKDPTVLTNLSGAIWDAGAKYTPFERLSLRLTYGRRFNQPNWDGSLIYEFAPDATITVAYTETLETSQSLLAGNLNFLAVGPNGTLIDIRTGRPFTAADLAFSLTNNTFLQKRFSTALQLVRDRNTFNLQVYDEQRLFQLGDISERSQGGAFTWSRDLPRNLELNASLTYIRTNFDGETSGELGRIDNLYEATVGVTYKMSESLQSNLSVIRTQRFSNFAREELTNNVVILTIAKQF